MSINSQGRAWVLDVGHGNSTVVEEQGHVSIIDGGAGDTLLRFLSDRGISRIDVVIVSHADRDHLRGISLLLTDTEFQVGQVYVNPDPRETDLWTDFVSEMLDAKSRGAQFKLELTKVNPGQLVFGSVRLEVLAPSQEFAIMTPGGRTPDGRRLTPNAMSAVVRVWAGDSPRLLLAGDIDRVGLDSLIASNTDVKADVLVFPHHGGLPGTSAPEPFAELLATAVGAQLVIFSIGRGLHGTPRPEILSAVMRGTENVHIACTQLSTHCAADLPEFGAHWQRAVADGASKKACCAGTLEISLDGQLDYSPDRGLHSEFVDQNAPTALCRVAGESSTQ